MAAFTMKHALLCSSIIQGGGKAAQARLYGRSAFRRSSARPISVVTRGERMKPEAVRRTVTYHEAGHAVVARLLGVNINSVTIAEEAQEAVVPTSSSAYAARESGRAAQVAGYEIDGKIALAWPIAQLMSRPNRDDRVAKAARTSHEEDFANAKNAAACIALLYFTHVRRRSGPHHIDFWAHCRTRGRQCFIRSVR